MIDDTHDYGTLSFTDVMVKSSNVGAIKVGLKLGPERLGLYVRRFGFGRALSPDFPGETTGIVWDPRKLDNSALASMSMGYQVGVTPLQMVAAVSSVANGGDLIQPRVVRALDSRRQARRSEADRPRPDDLERHRRHAHRHHGADRRAWNGDLRAGRGLHHRRQNRNGIEARQRPLLEYATTTRRLSDSSRRAIRSRPSSSSSIRRMRTGTTAGRLPVRYFSASRRRRFGTLACRRR